MKDGTSRELPPMPVYVASPLGFSLPTRIFYNRTLLPALRANGARILDPWDLPFDDLDRALAVPAGLERLQAMGVANNRIGARNARLIREAKIVFAILDGADIDSGTAAEIGFAAALQKPIVGWRSDFRMTGDNEAAPVNLQVAFFVQESGGTIHSDLGDAIDALRRIGAASSG